MKGDFHVGTNEMKRIIAIFSLLVLCSCSNNVREFQADDIRVKCRPIGNRDNYKALIIGCPSRPYAGKPKLFVKLSGGKVLDLAADDLQSHLNLPRSDISGRPYTGIGNPQLDYGRPWPDGTIEMQDKGRVFRMKNGKLLSLYLYARHNPAPQLSRDGNTWFTLPLAEEEVIILFGKPDRFHEYLEE